MTNQTVDTEYPKYLKVLCTLSAINGFTSIFFRIYSAFSHPDDNAFNAIKQLEDGDKGMVKYAQEYEQAFRLSYVNHHLSIAALFVMGMFGIYEMYKLRKRGFFMYGLAHILIVFYPMLMVCQNAFSERQAMFDGGVTILFIALYASQLKHMKVEPNKI